MQYLILFLEGIITFISPCLLPMLPIYITYFASGEENKARTLKNALAFILGFTFIFVLMGAAAGSVGLFLSKHRNIVNIVAGFIVVLFGLNYLGVFKLRVFNGIKKANTQNLGFFSSMIFGVVFSVGWTPCVGAFLGSALLLATTTGSVLKGVLMLFSYSLGLGVPFFISAMLIDKLKGLFAVVKSNYRVINIVSGSLLVLLGVAMATGLFDKIIGVLL